MLWNTHTLFLYRIVGIGLPYTENAFWVHQWGFWPGYAAWHQWGGQVSKLAKWYPFLSNGVKERIKGVTYDNLLMPSVFSPSFLHSKYEPNPFKVGSCFREEEREQIPTLSHTCIIWWNLWPFHIRGYWKHFLSSISGCSWFSSIHVTVLDTITPALLFFHCHLLIMAMAVKIWTNKTH